MNTPQTLPPSLAGICSIQDAMKPVYAKFYKKYPDLQKVVEEIRAVK